MSKIGGELGEAGERIFQPPEHVVEGSSKWSKFARPTRGFDSLVEMRRADSLKRALHFCQRTEGPSSYSDGDESGGNKAKTKHECKERPELLSEALVRRAILSELNTVGLAVYGLFCRDERTQLRTFLIILSGTRKWC